MKNRFVLSLKEQIKKGDWTGYVTYYPHKKAYRPLPELNMTQAWKNVKELILYVHIPFCDKKCTYCNLFSTVLNQSSKQKIYEEYVDKVLEEIDFYKDFVPKEAKIMTIYFGGGTPSVLSGRQIEKILNKLRETFQVFDQNIEVCMECSPDQLSKNYIEELKNAGIQRISVGVQSLVVQELKIINRSTDIRRIYDIRIWAKELGINVNFDLIYGLPLQTKKSFFYSLDEIIKLSPESICTYPLAVRPHTVMSKVSKNKIFSMKQKYKMFKKIRRILEKNGYSCETIVRFTKSTSTCQMEKYEYQGISTLGFGAGARSYAPDVNYCVTYKVQDKLVKSIIDEYMNTDAKNRKFDGYVYCEEDHKIKYIMLNLISEGASEKVFYAKFDCLIKDTFPQEIEALKHLKLIKENKKEQIYNLTKKGMQYCDLVANVFVGKDVQKLYDSYKAE